MRTESITSQESEVLTCIKRFRSENGFSPVYAEISERIGISIPTARTHVLRLMDKGYISMERCKARTITVL